MITELETDEFGCVNNICYHDGYLLGLKFTDPFYKTLVIYLMSVDEIMTELLCEEIIASDLSNFRNGSGIFDVYKWDSQEHDAKIIIGKLGFVDKFNEIIEEAKNKICLKIECIDDCELVVICRSLKCSFLESGKHYKNK